MSNDIITQYELTNTCACTVYDEATGEYSEEPSTYCDGTCWEFSMEDFYNVNEKFLNSNETGWWKVSNLGLWDGDHSGYIYVKPSKHAWMDTARIVEGMTVRSEWNMRYTPYDDHISYSLSHHDSMGSNTTLTAVTEEQREELGLY